jgi:hypothetical protein
MIDSVPQPIDLKILPPHMKIAEIMPDDPSQTATADGITPMPHG